MMSTEPRSVSRQTLLALLTAGHLVNDFYALVLPFLLPTLIQTFQMNFTAAGLLALITELAGGVLQPVAGWIGDRFAKRKALILVGFTAFIAGLILVGTAASYTMILLAWLIYGLGTATFHPQSTNLITRVYTAAKGRAMGIHGIGGAIGNLSAPLVITGLVTSFGWRYATILLIIPGLIVLYWIGTRLREPTVVLDTSSQLRMPSSVWLLALTSGLIYMTYKGFLIFLPTFLVEKGATLNQAGWLSALMLAVGFVAQPIGGVLYDRFGGRWVFVLSALCAGSALLLFRTDSLATQLFLALVIGAAAAITFPASLAMASDLVGEGNVGMSVGIVFGVSGILSALTPAFIGYIADLAGLQMAFQWLVIFPLVALPLSLWLPSKVT